MRSGISMGLGRDQEIHCELCALAVEALFSKLSITLPGKNDRYIWLRISLEE